MDFYELPDDVVLELIRQWGWVTYRALKRQFYLDDDVLDDLKEELIKAQRIAAGWWRTQQYWGQTVGRQDRWVFQDKQRHGTLRKFAWTQIIRHRLVPTTYAPDDPTLQDCWAQRRSRTHTTAGRAGQLARRQQGLCPVCHQALENGEDLHVHHVVPKKHGGTDDLANLRLVHHNCHRQLHSTSAPLGVCRWLEPCTG